MKTNIKIILFSICTILLIFTSCTKELGCMDPYALNYNPEAKKDDGSCIDIINGCMDILSINYNIEANVSDESCLYAYDIAQGIWNITPDCDDITIPIVNITISLNDQLPESIEVQGDGDNQLFISAG